MVNRIRRTLALGPSQILTIDSTGSTGIEVAFRAGIVAFMAFVAEIHVVSIDAIAS